MNKLLTPFQKNGTTLKNHLVMAPMTRSRALNNIPNEIMANYYSQRTGAGLIITEGTSPLPEGLGYARIPGIFSPAQVAGWKKVTDAVHAGNSRIFLQLMHTGRMAHTANLPEGAQVVGVSSIKATGEIYTDAAGNQPYSTPVALTTEGVQALIAGHVKAAENAIEAGFDGIELHGANGYLIEQFLNPAINNRTDEYGGSMENRARLALEMAQQIGAAIGKEKTGIRFSPYSELGDLPAYQQDEVHATYTYLAEELEKMGIAYIHIGVNAVIPQKTFDAIRRAFNGTIILCNGLTPETALTVLDGGFADLVAFGRHFLANPDLDQRIAVNATLNQPDYSTLYTPGENGYTDYPFLTLSPEKI